MGEATSIELLLDCTHCGAVRRLRTSDLFDAGGRYTWGCPACGHVTEYGGPLGSLPGPTTFHKRQEFRTKGSQILSLAYSDDGALLASGALDGTVWLVNVLEQRLVGEIPHRGDGKILALAFVPGEQRLIFGSGHAVTICDPLTTRDVQRLRHPGNRWSGGVVSVAFQPHRADCMAFCSGKGVAIWHRPSGTRRHWLRPRDSLLAYAKSMCFTSDGAFCVVSLGVAKRLWAWPTDTWQHPQHVGVFPGISGCYLRHIPGTTLVAGYGLSGALLVWDVPTGKEVTRTSVPGMIYSGAVFPDGQRILIAGSEGVQVRSVYGEAPTATIPVEGVCSECTIHPQGTSLALGFGDGRVELYDCITGRA